MNHLENDRQKGRVFGYPIDSSHEIHDRHGAPFLWQRPCDRVDIKIPAATEERREGERNK